MTGKDPLTKQTVFYLTTKGQVWKMDLVPEEESKSEILFSAEFPGNWKPDYAFFKMLSFPASDSEVLCLGNSLP